MEHNNMNDFEEFYNKKRQKERRDMFAAAALQGILAANENTLSTVMSYTKTAVKLADDLIAELDKEK